MSDAERWERETFSRAPERDAPFTTLSGEPIRPLYTEADLPAGGRGRRSACRASFRSRAGVYAVDVSRAAVDDAPVRRVRDRGGDQRRFRYLLEHGQTGLSTAFDMPSLMGHDSDHPRSLGEVGREGVAVDTLEDMEMLFDGIPLDRGHACR